MCQIHVPNSMCLISCARFSCARFSCADFMCLASCARFSCALLLIGVRHFSVACPAWYRIALARKKKKTWPDPLPWGCHNYSSRWNRFFGNNTVTRISPTLYLFEMDMFGACVTFLIWYSWKIEKRKWKKRLFVLTFSWSIQILLADRTTHKYVVEVCASWELHVLKVNGFIRVCVRKTKVCDTFLVEQIFQPTSWRHAIALGVRRLFVENKWKSVVLAWSDLL